MFIVAGTGLLTDAYGVFVEWGPYNLFKWSMISKLCGCKLLFVCVGAGPIYSALGRWFTAASLRLADFRSYRDQSSRSLLGSIGFETSGDPVYPDLAFSLPEIALPQFVNQQSERTVVGIGLMDDAGKYSSERPDHAIYLSYLENLAAFVRWLLARQYDVRILTGEIWWDQHVTQEFKDLLKGSLLPEDEKRVIHEPALTVEQLLSQIAATDFVVATRFHNLVLSLVLNKPVLSISFHHKCVSLMAQMDLSRYSNDINQLDSSRLIEQFRGLERDRDVLKAKIRQRVEEFREALDEQYSLVFNDMWQKMEPSGAAQGGAPRRTPLMST